MSKTTSGVLGVLILLLVGLTSAGGWMLHQHALDLTQLKDQQQQLIQQQADLNDRMVAALRPQPILTDAVPTSAASAELLREVVRQSLQVAQTALQADQPDVALGLLVQTQQQLATPTYQMLAPALLAGLSQKIAVDINELQKTADLKRQARGSVQVALSRVQRALLLSAQHGPTLAPHAWSSLNQPAAQAAEQTERPDGFWQRMRQVVRIEPAQAGPQASVAIRALICHQVALTLGMARTALQQQQIDQAQALMREAHVQLSSVPDADARSIDQSLKQLLNMPIPAPIQLQSLAFLPTRSHV